MVLDNKSCKIGEWVGLLCFLLVQECKGRGYMLLRRLCQGRNGGSLRMWLGWWAFEMGCFNCVWGEFLFELPIGKKIAQ